MFFSMSKTPACAGILCKKKKGKKTPQVVDARRASRALCVIDDDDDDVYMCLVWHLERARCV